MNYLEFYNVKQKNEFRKSHHPDFFQANFDFFLINNCFT